MITVVNIKTTDGDIGNISVKDYDAEQLTEELNDNSKNYVDIGNTIIRRNSVIRIVPVDTEDDGVE